MARASGVSHVSVGRIEQGTMSPSLALLERILAVAGLRLVAVDDRGQVIRPMVDWPDALDGAERRYPAHLDTIIDPGPGEWWADQYGLTRPPETFQRDREARDVRRRRSQWEVRVSKYRQQPPPPLPR
jgi:transcriptional regulator with XRE-family HTH domain